MASRRGSPSRVGLLIEGALRRFHLDLEFKKWLLLDQWPELVGPELAARSRATRIKNRVLFVEVDNSAWAQELQSGDVKGLILKKVNERLGGPVVADVRFRIGPGRRGKVDKREAPLEAPGELDQELVARSVAGIADPELRAQAARAMFRFLARTKAKPPHD